MAVMRVCPLLPLYLSYSLAHSGWDGGMGIGERRLASLFRDASSRGGSDESGTSGVPECRWAIWIDAAAASGTGEWFELGAGTLRIEH